MNRSQAERMRGSQARKSEKQSLTAIQRLNNGIFNIISALFADLAIDQAGKLLFNVKNINTANRVAVRIQRVYQRESQTLTQRIVKNMLRLFRINTDYFKGSKTPVELTGSLEERVLNRIMKIYGYNVAENLIDPMGYLAGNLRSPSHALAVSKRVMEAIAGRMPLKDFQKTFRKEFNRPGSALNAQHHYNRFARDLYQEFDRTVQLEYANNLGLTHAIYSGTVKDNTRPFCEDRVNRIYTESEIDNWNGQQWKGKKPGDVRTVLGGYNCRHILSWISEETAEQIAKRRGQEINSYN